LISSYFPTFPGGLVAQAILYVVGCAGQVVVGVLIKLKDNSAQLELEMGLSLAKMKN
jgi:hypothetical protein